jgi:hypothetical protein
MGKQLFDVRSQQLTPLLTAGHMLWQSESAWHVIMHMLPPLLLPWLDPSSPLPPPNPDDEAPSPVVLSAEPSPKVGLGLLKPPGLLFDPDEPHAINTARTAG